MSIIQNTPYDKYKSLSVTHKNIEVEKIDEGGSKSAFVPLELDVAGEILDQRKNIHNLHMEPRNCNLKEL